MLQNTTKASSPPERNDAYTGVIPEPLEVETLRALSRVSPWTSVVHIVWEWGCILFAAWVGWCYWSPWLYFPVVAFIGARQHALIILMHEGAHYRLFKNHKLNDWVSEIMLAWPFILFTMRAYRCNHWAHHRHTNGEGDPDWVRKQTPDWAFPKSRRGLLGLLALDLVGAGFVKFVMTARKLPREVNTASADQGLFRAARLGFLAAVFALLTVFNLWALFALFWLVPFITWMQLAFHIRSIAEHFALPEREGVFGKTRTTVPTMFDRVFLVPKNVGYHLEHHLFPSVPFYNLPRLHNILMQRASYRSSVHVTRGYWRVLHECLTQGTS